MTRKISNFKSSDDVYRELVHNALKDCLPGALEHVYVGVDEGLNHPVVFEMLENLISCGAIRNGGALWRELRIQEDGSESYIYGGSSRRNRKALKSLGDIGKPVLGVSDDDSAILDILITHFLSFGRVVLLSADKRFDTRGDFFGPLLAGHLPPLSLIAIFKESPNLKQYCSGVSQLLEECTFEPGYTEFHI